MNAVAGSSPLGSVLVVDDDPDSLRMILIGLETAGLTVLVATSGEAALDVLANARPDIVLMDAMMQGIDGFETTRRIRGNPALRHIPVIFMTGLADPGNVVKGLQAGGIDYVGKPVDIDELVARLFVHMAQGLAAHAGSASLDATGRMMFVTDGRGGLLWSTPLAGQALVRADPRWRSQSGRLPDVLLAPVERLCGQDGTSGKARIEHEHGVLELAMVARLGPREILLRLTEQDPAQDIDTLGRVLGITGREAEVLLWVSYGKASKEISEILKISPRTVQKHLERIFEKLGVETRSAATAMATRTLGQ